MTVKADWDMNIDYNRLQKQVDENPRHFYNNFDNRKNSILKNNYRHDFNTLKTEKQLQTQQNNQMKAHQSANDYKTIQHNETVEDNKLKNFDALLSKVSSDIDKKSSYSRQMQKQFDKDQKKQAQKNMSLLIKQQSNASKKDVNKQKTVKNPDDIFTAKDESTAPESKLSNFEMFLKDNADQM